MNEPIADFSAWFSGNAVSQVSEEKERQDWKLGLIYETFRRHPEVLRAKVQAFQQSQPGWSPSTYREIPWVNSPWNAAAFRFWPKPWSKLKKREKGVLVSWSAAGAKGPPGVSTSVSKLLPDGGTEVCKYVPTKMPMTIKQGDGTESRVELELLETNPELEKQGWKLFAIDCRSKAAVKRAATWIIKNHAVKGGHGTARLESWTSRLNEWNQLFASGPSFRVTILEDNLSQMEKAWKKLKLGRLAPPLADATI
jgi:hypothetical protein